jgi:hypothetical protein
MTLKQALLSINSQSTRCWLYLPATVSWTLESLCLIAESEEVPPEEEDDPDAGMPQIAKDNELMQVLSVSEVQDLVENVKAQKSDVSDEELFEAFLYYYDNDAYMELKGT